MSNIVVLYWSGSGNTEKMAQLIAEGASATCKHVADATPDELHDVSLVTFGSPALGDEGIDETELAPFIASANAALQDKTIALFGSYGWGNGEWLRLWGEELSKSGCRVLPDRLAIREAPEGDDVAKCIDFGRALAKIAQQ
ncbi:flavodoxin domain-containing protein [Synergistaceae bacterium OttesenSCG-928-I11]|nr:flavodoxin domain-containing protein [Synergistaceae bacterium OttesenSCG-928-I11]